MTGEPFVRVALVPDRRFLYVSVPKAMTTSVFSAIAAVTRPDEPQPADPARFHAWMNRDILTVADVRDLAYCGWRWMTVVRDPVERFVSAFWNQIAPTWGDDIDALVANQYKLARWMGNVHLRPQVDFVQDLSLFDFVGRVEEPARVEGALSLALGRDVRLRRLNASDHRREPSGRSIDRLRELYARDLEMLAS